MLTLLVDQEAPQFAMGVFVDVSQLEMWETFRLKCRRSFGANYEKMSEVNCDEMQF